MTFSLLRTIYITKVIDKPGIIINLFGASIDLNFMVTLHVHEGRYSFPTHGLFNSSFKSLYEHGTHIGSEYEEGGDAIIEQLKWDLNL